MTARVGPPSTVDALEAERFQPSRGSPALPRVLGAVGLCVLPLLAFLLSPLRADVGLLYIGLLPAFVALTGGARLSLAAAVATGVVVLVGLLVSQSPWAAALLLAALAGAVGWSYTRGWQGATTYVATQAALATVAAPALSLLDADRHPADSWANAALVALVVTAAGLWVAAVGRVLLPDLRREPARRPWGDDLSVFTGLLGLLLALTTLVVMQRSSTANAWWILLTILVTMTPDLGASPARATQRAGGTIAGGGVAALLVVGGLGKGLLSGVGLVAVVVSVVAYVRAPYWVFTAALTLALVLLTFPEGRVLRGDLERVAFTVLAAVVVAAVTVVVERGLRLVRP